MAVAVVVARIWWEAAPVPAAADSTNSACVAGAAATAKQKNHNKNTINEAVRKVVKLLKMYI